MKRRRLLLLLFPATVLFSALACGGEIPVEPYSSKPTVRRRLVRNGGRPVPYGLRRGLGNHGRRLATQSELASGNAQAGQ